MASPRSLAGGVHPHPTGLHTDSATQALQTWALPHVGPSFNVLGAGPQGLAPWKRPGPVTRLLLFLLCRWETMLLQIYFNRASSDSLAPSNREALKMAFLSTASVARGPRGLKLALERA